MTISMRLGANRASVLPPEGVAASASGEREGLERLRESFKSLDNRMTAFEGKRKERKGSSVFTLKTYMHMRHQVTNIEDDLNKGNTGSLQSAADQAQTLADRYAQRAELLKNESIKKKSQETLKQMHAFDLELSALSEAVVALADTPGADEGLRRLQESFKSLENRMMAFERQRKVGPDAFRIYAGVCVQITSIEDNLKAGSLQSAANQMKALADRYAQRGELLKNKSITTKKREKKLRRMYTIGLELSAFSKAAAALADEMAVSAQASPAGPVKPRPKRLKENRGSKMLRPKASVRANEGPEQAAHSSSAPVLSNEELVGLLNTSKVPSIAKEMQEQIEKSHNNRDHGSQSPVKTNGLSKESKTQPASEKKPVQNDRQLVIRAAQGRSSTAKTGPQRGSLPGVVFLRRAQQAVRRYQGLRRMMWWN